jgi:predicted deacetylase
LRDTTAPPQRLILASIHDVSPRFESEVDSLIDALQPHIGGTLALLVVPNHWGESPIVPGTPFATRLRNLAASGSEIFLHGYFHRDHAAHERIIDKLRAGWMTAGEGEFLALSCSDAVNRIERGRALLEDVTGRSIAGFIAPAWLYSKGAIQGLRDCAIPIAEDHLRVWSPSSGVVLSRSPVITWASRSPARLRSSLLTAAVLRQAPVSVLRIGVHPPDCRSPQLLRSIEKTFRIATRSRRPARYSELLPESPRLTPVPTAQRH